MLVLLAWICGKEAEDRNDDLMGDIKKKERERKREIHFTVRIS